MATVTADNRIHHDEAPSDEDLMFEYQDTGSQKVFSDLIYRYESRLYNSLMSTGLVSSQEAEEIFQDTWLRAHIMKDQFEPGMLFSSWLGQIATARASLFIALRPKEPKRFSDSRQ